MQPSIGEQVNLSLVSKNFVFVSHMFLFSRKVEGPWPTQPPTLVVQALLSVNNLAPVGESSPLLGKFWCIYLDSSIYQYLETTEEMQGVSYILLTEVVTTKEL